jgi:hypothetical protein
VSEGEPHDEIRSTSCFTPRRQQDQSLGHKHIQNRRHQKQPLGPSMIVKVIPASNDDDVSVLSFLGHSVKSASSCLTDRRSAISENSSTQEQGEHFRHLPVTEPTGTVNGITNSSMLTMMTNNNNFDQKTGRCIHHPHLHLLKKKLFGRGWKILMSVCPDCCVSELCRIRMTEANKMKCYMEKDASQQLNLTVANSGIDNRNTVSSSSSKGNIVNRSSSCFTRSSSLRSSGCDSHDGQASYGGLPSNNLAPRMPPPPSHFPVRGSNRIWYYPHTYTT